MSFAPIFGAGILVYPNPIKVRLRQIQTVGTGMASVLGCCTGCDTKWSGEKYCHCGKCHITTSTISNWDKHRVNGSCVGPETVGLVRNERGVWTMPGSGFFEVDDD